MRMPFGKYKGWDLARVPRPYREWLLARDDLDATLRAALVGVGATTPIPTAADLARIVRDWHHKLKLKYHPELGGTAAQMAVVDEGAELLRELLKLKV